jgi:hypothetical protein
LTIAAAAKPNDNASDDEEVDKEDTDGDMKLAASIRAIGKKLISQDAEDKDWEMTEIDADGNVIEASTTSLAQNVLLPVMQWLWAVKHSAIATSGGINISIPPCVEEWAESVVAHCLVTGTPPTATTGGDNSDLITAIQALMAATTALQQQTMRTSPDKTCDDGNTPKMTAANRWLLLWASEMVEQPDEFGIMAKPPPPPLSQQSL